MKRETLRKITAAIVAFGASVLLTVTILCLVIGAVFSRPYFSLLTGDSYKQRVTNEVLEGLESYAIPGGLPHDYFEEKLDRQLLHKDVDRAVDAAFKAKSVTFETFSAAVKQSIIDYATENNIEVTAGDGTTEENIDHMASLCASKYKKIVNSEIIKFGGAISRFLHPWCLIAAAVLAALAAGLLIATFKIGRLVFLRMALSGAGFMAAGLPIYFLLFKNINKLGITSASMYSLSTGLIYSIFIALLIFAVALFVLANLPYKRKEEKPEE